MVVVRQKRVASDARLDVGLIAWNDPRTSLLDGGMSDRLKWMLGLCGIVAFTVVGLTALDSYDEGTCRETPTVRVSAVPNPVYDATDFDSGPPLFIRRVPEACDGFLPW
jgi:hypothetical protein